MENKEISSEIEQGCVLGSNTSGEGEGRERGFSAPKTRLPLIGQGGSGREAVQGILPAGQEELV